MKINVQKEQKFMIWKDKKKAHGINHELYLFSILSKFGIRLSFTIIMFNFEIGVQD